MTTTLYCPVRATLALLGQKWVPHIIHELMGGKRRFNELAHDVGGCNSRTLRDRLKNLECSEIVDRNIVAVMPPWVEYELTPQGPPARRGARRARTLGPGVHDAALHRLIVHQQASSIDAHGIAP